MTLRYIQTQAPGGGYTTQRIDHLSQDEQARLLAGPVARYHEVDDAGKSTSEEPATGRVRRNGQDHPGPSPMAAYRATLPKSPKVR